MSEPVRLSKRLIELTGCTRREAELYIEGGWVLVNGIVVEYPQTLVSDDEVQLDANADLTSAGPVTILVNKPSELAVEELLSSVDPANHWGEDASGIRLLKRHFRYLKECFPLDPSAGGLCILTQNRHLERRWQERQAILEQEYVVDFEGDLTESELTRLNEGCVYRGERLPSAKVSRQKETRLRFALKNPQPGQIQHLCESVGLSVVALTRLRLGAVPLRKVPKGQWRYLPEGDRF